MQSKIFDLEGKQAVITGGASGIGFAIAKALNTSGTRCFLVGRNRGKLESAARELGNNSGETCFSYDLLNEKEIKLCAKDISDRFGTPDIVVNAAGINLREKAEDITFETWNQTLDINLKAPFFFTREFLPKMVQRKSGKVINIASLQSFRAFADSIPYGSSKGGVIQLTKAMAQEYSKHNIQINSITPGFFPTPLTEKLFRDEAKVKYLAEQTAIGRNGKPEDFEGVSVFLASQASDYVTGTNIFLDGGFSAK